MARQKGSPLQCMLAAGFIIKVRAPKIILIVVVLFLTITPVKACLENIRGEDFEIDYNSANQFRFMGNGITAREVTKGEDLSFYMTV